jgi:hypothetical protein
MDKLASCGLNTARFFGMPLEIGRSLAFAPAQEDDFHSSRAGVRLDAAPVACGLRRVKPYSTVTDFARLRG